MISRIPPAEQLGLYRLPRHLIARIAWATATLQRRSFARDAQAALAGLRPELLVLGSDRIPPTGPCLVTCNHYNRPGFHAWWLTLAISAAVASRRAASADREIHWVMTAAWTFPESRIKRRVLTPLTRWAFARVARVYGFVTMPPMPPHPDEVEARAAAVRQAVRMAHRAAREGGMVGLAPEGQDLPSSLIPAQAGIQGMVGQPPKGAGLFLALLVQAGLPVLPVGVAEEGGRLRVSFGPLFVPKMPTARRERDRVVSQQVMDEISRQLPQ